MVASDGTSDGDAMKAYAQSMELKDLAPDSSESKTDSFSSTSSTVSRNPDHPIVKLQDNTQYFCANYGKIVWRVIAVLCLIGYTIYLGFAINHSVSMATAFIVVTCLVIFFLIWGFIRDNYGDEINRVVLEPLSDAWDRNFHIIKW